MTRGHPTGNAILRAGLILATCLTAGRILGQPAPDHWAFQPLRTTQPPTVASDTWSRTPVDRFILARLQAADIPPPAPADRRSLLRRAAFSLTGLPPTAEEIEAFEADPSPDAFARRTAQLLDSPRYGEHWARHWLDVVRYADTAGETADYPVPEAWRYRNYVIDALNTDLPYDVFLHEQVAGDILARREPGVRHAERVTATGFIALSRRFGFDSENYHHLTLQDTLDTLGQSVLGLSIGCARCHTHKYDPIPMADYYALYGIFESTRYAFPGSEQKQRVRTLSPLLPPSEARPAWRTHQARVARLARFLRDEHAEVPAAVLRPLDDFDGDFELQAPAAGGSKGVLVAPWRYEGAISVTPDAQSPFVNLVPPGRVGVQLPGGTQPIRLFQQLPACGIPDGDPLHASLDLRIPDDAHDTPGGHRIRFLDRLRRPVAELRIGSDGLRAGTAPEPIPLPPNTWQQVQLVLDPQAHTGHGRIGDRSHALPFGPFSLTSDWEGGIGWVEVDTADDGVRPGLQIDNLTLGTVPPPPPDSDLALESGPVATGPGRAELERDLRDRVGFDGGFEFQREGAAPTTPWHPGPSSTVQIRAAAQSPLGPGSLGIHLPAGAPYQGFGQSLPRAWKSDAAPHGIRAGFDFRPGVTAPEATGTWRFYLGHGPGHSAAVELYLHAGSLFRRSGERRDAVAALAPGRWHRVDLDLDLAARTFRGTLRGPAGTVSFDGEFAGGWDGILDETFIDSYGHQSGPRPSLDADRFVIEAAADPTLAAAPNPDPEGLPGPGQREEVAVLRAALARRDAAIAAAREELERCLIDGPFPMAYAVTEGTPESARIHNRGEPDNPGNRVPRGFLTALGGGALPEGTEGSGRWELARWLTTTAAPLTARVMVNRVWQHHFGKGLVATPNDFGIRGAPPADPELLDWLASRFIESGWSVKSLHRLLLASAVYQQPSAWTRLPATPTPTGANPECPMVSGSGTDPAPSAPPGQFQPFARRRLTAEEIRDAILQVCGSLRNPPPGGHPFPPATRWTYTQHGPYSGVYDHEHRSVYLMTQRLKRHPFLALFDGPDPATTTAVRGTSTVPTQALFFLNDPFLHEQADRLASRLATPDSEPAERIRAAFRSVLARNPTPAELEAGTGFLSAYTEGLRTAGTSGAPAHGSLAAWIRVLLSSNEFLTVD